MKELIKNIKYNRFPKEVLILIKILNENIDTKNNPTFTIKAPNDSFLFNIYDSNTIVPYYYNLYSFMSRNEFPKTTEFSDDFILYKNYTRIAIENSIYANYNLL